jgi:hypothetical protein
MQGPWFQLPAKKMLYTSKRNKVRKVAQTMFTHVSKCKNNKIKRKKKGVKFISPL